MRAPTGGCSPVATTNGCEVKKAINSELWHACAGPLVSLPPVGSLVVYFPQGHSEQVAASMQKDIDGHVPNYPNLPSKLICLLHNVTLHADPETDEVYAQMTLQPVTSYEKEALQLSELALKQARPQTEFFCKTLTASDTSTHGGFSVPRRAAEKIFPSLDFSLQPPAQEIQARDLHDNLWTFRHIYRGQPKRHLLTTGWSLFVSGKRLFAGDSVIFVRDDKQQLLLGIRRANKQAVNMSSSVLSSDSMHIGILAAAAHAAANNSPFTIFYNPRASPSEFVIPFAKYQKAVYGNQLSLGMRFRMMFETEELGTRRYMGTITGISDLDPIRWKNSQWRNLQVGWDESAAGERRSRVSIWEIEPVAAPFFICPPPFFSTKRSRPDEESLEMETFLKRAMPWLGEEICIKDPQSQSTMIPGLSLVQWMNMNQNQSSSFPNQPSTMQNLAAPDLSRQFAFQNSNNSINNGVGNIQFGNTAQRPMENLTKISGQFNQFNAVPRQQHQQPQMNPTPTVLPSSQTQMNNPMQAQAQVLLHNQLQQQQQQPPPPFMHNQIPLSHQKPQASALQQIPQLQQQQMKMPGQMDHQLQLQLLQKLQQQQNQLQQPASQMPTSIQDQQKMLLEMQQQFLQPKMMVPDQQQLHKKVPETVYQPTAPAANVILPSGVPQSSVLADDIPSFTTSPSTHNTNILPQPVFTMAPHVSPIKLEKPSQPELDQLAQKSNNSMNQCAPISKMQNQGTIAQNCVNNVVQLDCLDTSSSATSVSFSQADGILGQVFPPVSPLNVFKDLTPINNSMFVLNGENNGVLTDELLVDDAGIDVGDKYHNRNNSISENMVNNNNSEYNGGGGLKEAQEISSSMISHSFGVSDMGFNNSIDSSAINENALLNNRSSWPPPSVPLQQRLRTFTKVYKRGAVGRSIDISRYSGYKELKQDLARMFSIEGQLEDRGRVGWKLVYKDHEDDILLVGDDPWAEFVNCVRCIRILSPQEVQQMSLDGDLVGNNNNNNNNNNSNNVAATNQACSSSDGGNVWRTNQNSTNPSPISYDHFD